MSDSFKTGIRPCAWILARTLPLDRRRHMNIEFVSSVAVIAPDPPASRVLYVESLGLPLEVRGGEYYASERVAGCKHFGVWPLSQAAEACFGNPEWPADRPVPQVSIEFDVPDATAVQAAAAELQAA